MILYTIKQQYRRSRNVCVRNKVQSINMQNATILFEPGSLNNISNKMLFLQKLTQKYYTRAGKFSHL